MFLTVDEVYPRNTINCSKKAPWQVVGTFDNQKIYLKIFPTSTRQTLAAANVNIGDVSTILITINCLSPSFYQVIHAAPVTISSECYNGVEKTSCYITWVSVINILYNHHRDPTLHLEGDDHAVPCENLQQISTKAKNTVIGMVYLWPFLLL